MSRRRKALLAGALLLIGLLVLPFALRWSRPCDEERARARETWTAYGHHVAGTRAQQGADAVLDALDVDLEAAQEHGDDVLTGPAPDDVEGARLYREAMERLSLAHGACGG